MNEQEFDELYADRKLEAEAEALRRWRDLEFKQAYNRKYAGVESFLGSDYCLAHKKGKITGLAETLSHTAELPFSFYKRTVTTFSVLKEVDPRTYEDVRRKILVLKRDFGYN